MTDWLPVSEFRERGPVVLRMQLVPLTLGHLELLDELDIDPFGNWTVPQFILLTVVLAQSHRQSRADLKRWWFPAFLWFLGFINRKSNPTEDAERMGEWIAGQVSGPRPMRDLGKKGGQCAAPLHVNLMANVLQKFSLSLDDARSLPVRRAKQLVMAAAEAAGEVELVSPSYDRFIAQCHAADEAEIARTRN